MSLTSLIIPKLPRGAGNGPVARAWEKAEIDSKWTEGAWAKNKERMAKRRQLTDFERFKVMRLRKQVRNAPTNIRRTQIFQQHFLARGFEIEITIYITIADYPSGAIRSAQRDRQNTKISESIMILVILRSTSTRRLKMRWLHFLSNLSFSVKDMEYSSDDINLHLFPPKKKPYPVSDGHVLKSE